MINIAALALLLSSLAAAGVWSPAPNPPAADPHLVREGHRLIVVEYERHVPLESQPHPPSNPHNLIEESKDKFQEASNLLPNVGQGILMPESAADAVEKPAHSAKELLCDAYGSCKEKISSVLHKGKDKISRKASDIKDNAEAAVESAVNKASAVGETTKGVVKDKMDSAKDAVRTAAEGAKDAVKSAVEVSRDAETDVVGNISRAAGMAADRAEEVAGLVRRNLTDITGRAKDVVIDAARYVGAPETARAAASLAHLLAFATAYGTCVWVTFVSSHVLAAALPRQQFGVVQSRLYPVYFRAVAYAIGIACLGHFFAKETVVGVERVQGYNLLAALGLVLVNMFYLEPKATKVMFERMKIEKEEGRGRDMADGEPVVTASATTTTAATAQSGSTIGVVRTRVVATDQDAAKGRAVKLSKKLKKLNTYSSFVNILTLMSLTWHLGHLSRRLQMTC